MLFFNLLSDLKMWLYFLRKKLKTSFRPEIYSESFSFGATEQKLNCWKYLITRTYMNIQNIKILKWIIFVYYYFIFLNKILQWIYVKLFRKLDFFLYGIIVRLFLCLSYLITYIYLFFSLMHFKEYYFNLKHCYNL